MGEWKWTTYLLFVSISLVTTLFIKKAEQYAYVSQDNNKKIYGIKGNICLF